MSTLCVDVHVFNLAKDFLDDDNKHGDGIRRVWTDEDVGKLAESIQLAIEDFMSPRSQQHEEQSVETNEFDEAHAALAKLRATLAPLVAIADAYDANALDDEARKFYGTHDEFANDGVPPGHIELYNGRGGKRLLTLAHCLEARDAIRRSTR